ncbi:hypothetical protein [Citricoccus sp.]|uniref:phage holin n=1 Tax=Citricoccus sp. TaxID=1978372 RepID=UPI002CE5C77E|nr:hypothetical protein [Citricoccus sp.]HRO95084.1 hypothetical protein [Citricoccus sp.]
MRSVTREQLYAAVVPIVALLVGLGVLTDEQGVAVTGLAGAVLTLIYAVVMAVHTKAPIGRTAIYGVLAAIVAALAVWGFVTESTGELILAAAMGVVGVLVAESNTKPELGHDGIPDIPHRDV